MLGGPVSQAYLSQPTPAGLRALGPGRGCSECHPPVGQGEVAVHPAHGVFCTRTSTLQPDRPQLLSGVNLQPPGSWATVSLLLVMAQRWEGCWRLPDGLGEPGKWQWGDLQLQPVCHTWKRSGCQTDP